MTRPPISTRPALFGFGFAALALFGALWLRGPHSDEPIKQPNEYFHLQRAWPEHDIPMNAYAKALAQARALHTASARSAGAAWQEAGPSNVGGRVTAVAVDPASSSRYWVGTADGGVLRTDDDGASFTPLLDDFGGLSIGALAHHPTEGGTLLAGTGEANASGDSYDGIGVLKTTDGGDSWVVAGLPESQRIGRIAYDPTNPSIVHAAVSGGLFSKSTHRGMYRSTDGGDSWAQTLFVSDSTSAIDVVVDPSDGNNVYAAFWERLRGPGFRNVSGTTSRVWKSTDAGVTWAQLTTGLPTGSDVARIGLAIAPSQPSTLYAVYSTFSTSTGTEIDAVYKSTNSGASWSSVSNFSLGNPYSSFGWYFGNIRVAPSDPDIVYVLGVELMRSTNGGVNWTDVTSSQHVDFHALWIDPTNSNHLISGNDGGVYTSTNGSFWSKKFDLPISQFYAISVDPQLPQRIYGGTQDNSTLRTLTGAVDDWDVIGFGDGFTTIVDPTSSNVIYAEYQFGGLIKSTDTGSSWDFLQSAAVGSDRTNWHTPFVLAPSDPQTIYLGTYRVRRSTNGGNNWSSISPDLTDGPSGGNLTFNTLTTLAVAPSVANTIYAGSDDGNVHVTTNGGTTWTEIDADLPLRWITRVAVDPANDAIAYVTLSGYKEDEFQPHVFRSTNHGGSWTDISGNLPEAPVNDLVVDPLDSNRLYVATDVGVYVTNSPGGTWQKLGMGLPLSVVIDLELHNPTRELVAGTHGRSAFRLSLNDAVDAPAVVSAGDDFRLAPPRPNPSRGPAELAFVLPRAGDARVTIHDVGGRLVRTVLDGRISEGTHSAHWDGRDASGARVGAGVYFARLSVEGVTRTVKITRTR